MNKILTIIMILTLFAYGCASEAPQDTPKDGGNEKLELSSTALLDEISGILEKGLNAEYSVTYEMDYGEGKTDVTMYMKQGKIRTDATYQGIESRSYFVDNAATICTKQAEKFTCLKATGEEEVVNPADTKLEYTEYEEEISSESENFRVYRDGTITVSGNVAKCYKFQYGTETSIERTCVSDEGVLLYHKYTDGSEISEFIAKSYSTKVSDSVFELPAGAEIVDLNTQLNSIQTEYGENSVYDIGPCYEECESLDLSETKLEECYTQCFN